MEYFKAAKENKTWIHNQDGSVNKSNLSGLKSLISPVQSAPAKKHAQLETKDVVALSTESQGARGVGDLVKNFASAWS